MQETSNQKPFAFGMSSTQHQRITTPSVRVNFTAAVVGACAQSPRFSLLNRHFSIRRLLPVVPPQPFLFMFLNVQDRMTMLDRSKLAPEIAEPSTTTFSHTEPSDV